MRTKAQDAIWFSLGPVERKMLACMRARMSDRRIREAMMLGVNESLRIANSLREKLGCGMHESIVDAADRQNIYYDGNN